MQSNEQCLNCECFLIVDQYGVSIYIAEKFLEYAKNSDVFSCYGSQGCQTEAQQSYYLCLPFRITWEYYS